VLGSLALPAFADPAGHIDFDALDEAARLSVRFLDDVVEVNAFPDPECEAASRRTRKIGLGVMGFADLLLLRGEVYGSPESQQTASRVMARVERAVRSASEALAQERGVYPGFRGPGPDRRNASLLAIAPTGTLRLLAGCNGGIEPWLDPVVPLETARGDSHRWSDRWLLDWLEVHDYTHDYAHDDARADARDSVLASVVEALAKGVPSASLAALPERARALLRRAYEVPADAQLALQARFQKHVDGGVSKTVHLPPDVGAERIGELIQRARALGCKGVAFWRSAGLAPARCIRCGR
jgi:ribonucleoside-diphosphate reductase alpha chain